MADSPLTSIELAQLKRKQFADQKTTDQFAKSQDIGTLLKQMQEATLAQYLNGQKSTVVLTDQTDLGDKMQELGDKLATSVSQLNSADIDNKQLKAIENLSAAVETYNKQNGNISATASKELLAAIKDIDVSPVVNVPEANITVESAPVDLKPLQKTIEKVFTPPKVEKVDLECYRAQDITNADDFQYVGFVNPDGGWYIIENDTKNNSLRYIFGASGYAKAFKKASTYQYSLLNEAVDAL